MAAKMKKQRRMRILRISFAQMQNAARNLAKRILEKEGRPACIIYLERGGMVLARLLCDELGVQQVIGVRVSLYKAMGKRKKEVEVDEFPKRLHRIKGMLLLVDDVSDTGSSIGEVYKKLRKAVHNKIVTCTEDIKDGTSFVPDYYDRRVKSTTWIAYDYERKEVETEMSEK